MDAFDTIIDMLPYLIPLFVLELALLIIALVDLLNRKSVRGDKMVWVILIIFVGIIGPIIYFILGRQKNTIEEKKNLNQKFMKKHLEKMQEENKIKN